MFFKTNARSPNGKKMSISCTVWNRVQKYFDTVQLAIRDGKDLQLELMVAKHLTVSKFDVNSLWYIGIHELTPAGTIIPLSGMNFTEEEWNKLVSFRYEIETALQGSLLMQGSIKRHYSGQEVLRDVLMYRLSWMVGKKKASQSEITFFSKEDCRMDAALHKPEKDKTNLVVETVWGPPPLKHVQMHVISCFFS